MGTPDQAKSVNSAGDAGSGTCPGSQPDWQNAGFGVYIHWPFCLAKCPYCDFNSHVSRSIDQYGWRDALIQDTERFAALTAPRIVDTVFFGGGTPSLMPPSTVAALIERIDTSWGLARDAEITLEANPTSVEAAKFRDYAAAGVNRVSMGVQALNDADLKALGRTHTAADARAAFDIARSTFDRVSFDLIYARMGQTSAAWEAELGDALDMAIDHLSLYQLTIETGTRFGDLHAAGKLIIPADDRAAEMYALTQDITRASGMPAYEISNHARPGAESRHNQIYWRYGDYAGIGPGAHARLTLRDGHRYACENMSNPERWRNEVASFGHSVVRRESIRSADQAAEYLMMAMRLIEGASLARFAGLAGVPLNPTAIETLCASGHLARDGDRVMATPEGRMVLNTVIAELLR